LCCGVQWNREFEALFKIELTGTSLDTELVVENKGASPVDFQAAIHSYFDVSDISKVQ
jgi:D-hexose-6-phosphate mutarotase